MKKLIFGCILSIILLTFTGCSKPEYSNEIIGQWEKVVDGEVVESMTFYEDGKMRDGTYKLVGDQLQITRGEWVSEYTIEIDRDILTLTWDEGLFATDSAEYKRVK